MPHRTPRLIAPLVIVCALVAGRSRAWPGDPPPDPQNPFVLPWGRSSPEVRPEPDGGPVERAPTKEELRWEQRQNEAAALDAAFAAACRQYDAGSDYGAACRVFKDNAERGPQRGAGAYRYGECLWTGVLGAPDHAAALGYFRMAQAAGDPVAAQRIQEILRPTSDDPRAHRIASRLHALEQRDDLAFDELMRAGDLGDAEASREVGTRIEASGMRETAVGWMGMAAERGDARALEWLRVAAKERVARAAMWLARALVANGRVADGVAGLRVAVAKGELEPRAATKLAELFVSGRAKPNRGEVRKLYELALAAGEPVAVRLADVLIDGTFGTPKDAKRGLALLEERVVAGDREAMADLGARYAAGRGVASDLGKAHDLYAKAGRADEATQLLARMAEGGDAVAARELAVAYYNGRASVGGKLVQDYAAAWSYFQKAAAQGDPEALYSLGALSQRGHGTPPSDAEALRWYGLARDAGYRFAYNAIGLMHYRGEGTPVSVPLAVAAFRTGADLGDAEAMCNLGMVVLAVGEAGLPAGTGSAQSWFHRAAMAGACPEGNRWLVDHPE